MGENLVRADRAHGSSTSDRTLREALILAVTTETLDSKCVCKWSHRLGSAGWTRSHPHPGCSVHPALALTMAPAASQEAAR